MLDETVNTYTLVIIPLVINFNCYIRIPHFTRAVSETCKQQCSDIDPAARPITRRLLVQLPDK